jgi:hypothetical protein
MASKPIISSLVVSAATSQSGLALIASPKPAVAQRLIRKGVGRALARLESFQPHPLLAAARRARGDARDAIVSFHQSHDVPRSMAMARPDGRHRHAVRQRVVLARAVAGGGAWHVGAIPAAVMKLYSCVLPSPTFVRSGWLNH